MNVIFRKGKPEEAAALGRICFEAFKTISEKHKFPWDFPSPEAAAGLMEMMLGRADVYSVVAEIDGRAVGSNFLWEGSDVAGVGPITVDPETQNAAVGKKLMIDVIERAEKKGFMSVRLVQAAYHNRSLSLYTKLGFDTREPLSVMQGTPPNEKIEGYSVRPMTENDIETANNLCRNIHGHGRRQELTDAVAQKTGMVVEHDGRITGYTTSLGFFGHTIGESNEELKALIGAAQSFAGVGFLLPTRNGEVLRWCLEKGLKIVQPMTLMSRGVYQDPRGAFIPSVLF